MGLHAIIVASVLVAAAPVGAFVQVYGKVCTTRPTSRACRATTCSTVTRALSSSSSSSSSSSREAPASPRSYRHTLAVLTLPSTSADRIANDAVLETAMARTSHRLSVVLRGTEFQPTLSQLRSYVGEIYSAAWDCTLGFDRDEDADGQNGDGGIAMMHPTGLLDVIVYPQNLPNAAPEGWIALRPDLECVCSHDSLIGWSATGGSGTGAARLDVIGQGVGGLVNHVDAINADRVYRGLEPVEALHVEPWPVGAEVQDDAHVVFLEDSEAANLRRWEKARGKKGGFGGDRTMEGDIGNTAASADGEAGGAMLGGARISERSLYNSVAVGGTFDGMHYGHRKLLSLAVSSVQPRMGKLLIGVTEDDMLRSKSFQELIPPLEERIRGVRDFVESLAPGLKNRMRVVPIGDTYGPPGSNDKSLNDFDALVLSHETLPTGLKLNEHRVNSLGMEPLVLLCTRRTEPHGMSSTALRRMRKSGVRTEANMI